MAKSTIDLNPHQIHATLYAFNSPLSRGAILADEVGLGKTIEAGIIIAQLWAENKRRILIMCPASLRKQWQDELFTKFGLESEVWDGPSYLEKVNSGEKAPLTYDGIFIISFQFAYGHLQLIEKQPWGVVIIDEAHRFRRVYKGRDASKMAYEIREVIKDKPKVLLTATPLQNNLEELYGIASFIDDRLLGTPYSFKTRFADPIKQNPEIAQARLEELRNLIRGEEKNDPLSISGVITRTLRKQVVDYVPFRKRVSKIFDFTPTDEEIELYEKGIAPDTVEAFIGEPRIDLLIEEMDALPLKIAVREAAKRLQIPVIMVTGNGEGILLDVERYDLEPNLPILNGLMESHVLETIMKPSDLFVPREKVALARDFMGAKYLDTRLLDSFGKFGSELVGIPQLAESSFIRGAALCHAAKAIILGRPLPSGRYKFSFADQMRSGHH